MVPLLFSVLVKLATTSKLNPLSGSTAKICTCASTAELGTGKICMKRNTTLFFWRRISRMKSAFDAKSSLIFMLLLCFDGQRKIFALAKRRNPSRRKGLIFFSFSFLFHQHHFQSFSSSHQIAVAKVKEKIIKRASTPAEKKTKKKNERNTQYSESFLAIPGRSTWWSYGNPLQRKRRLCAGPRCTWGFEKRKTNNSERAGPTIGQAGVSRVEKMPSSSVGKWSHCWLLQQKDALSKVMLTAPKVSLGRVGRGHSSARAERTKLTREKRTNGGDCSEQVDSVGSEAMFESNGL